MEPLQGIENDIARKNYVPSFSKNSCPGIKTLNIESEPVKVFFYEYGRMPACNLHCMCNFFGYIFLYCVISLVLVNVLFCTV